MTKRNVALVTGEVYHVFTKSIAGYKIFNDEFDFDRIKMLLSYYQRKEPPMKFSHFLQLEKGQQARIRAEEKLKNQNKLVEIICFCIMPTHLHLVVRQREDEGIQKFLGVVLNGYTRYFNSVHKRKGPLWQDRFKSVHVKLDEQLLHLTRYVHLNPVTAYLVEKPEQWPHSSYDKFLRKAKENDWLCEELETIDVSPTQYREFVNDRRDYQRQLKNIELLLIDGLPE